MTSISIFHGLVPDDTPPTPPAGVFPPVGEDMRYYISIKNPCQITKSLITNTHGGSVKLTINLKRQAINFFAMPADFILLEKTIPHGETVEVPELSDLTLLKDDKLYFVAAQADVLMLNISGIEL